MHHSTNHRDGSLHMNVDRLTPKVTIGLPVHNGERYVAEAIQSILAQTYDNIELIISDNASTDRTEEICRRYAAQDPRVRYYRQAVNLGAAPNFNRVFESSGASRYFKWAAHDDWIAPNYLEECVGTLEADPAAVLCQSLIENVNADGQRLGTYDHTAAGNGSARPSDRFWARLKNPRCMEVFGVIRSDALAATGMIASYAGGDRSLLLELALRGRFLLVRQHLFFHRIHGETYSLRVCGRQTPHEELAWYSPQASRWNTLNTWMLYGHCLRIIHNRVESRAEQLRCYGYLVRTLGSWRRCVILLIEPLLAMDARLFRGYIKLKQIKRKAFGTKVQPTLNASGSSTAEIRPRLFRNSYSQRSN